MKRQLIAAFVTMALGGCSDRGVEVGSPLTLRLDIDGGRTVSIANCPVKGNDFYYDRECMIGSDDEAYVVDGDVPVLPAAAPYGVYLHFKSGYVPHPDNVTTTGAGAAVKAYAAPVNLLCCGGIPEQSEANRISVRVLYPDPAGMLMLVDQAVSAPSQISVVLDNAALYGASRPADVPANSGYAARFYVGSVPAKAGTCAQGDQTGVSCN